MPTLSNVKGIIPSLATAGGINVLRASAPTINARFAAVPGVRTSIHVEPVVVHNLSGRDIPADRPEANRNRENIEIYTYDRLFVSDDGKDCDIVVYRNRQYQVYLTMDYTLQGGCYISYADLADKQNNV